MNNTNVLQYISSRPHEGFIVLIILTSMFCFSLILFSMNCYFTPEASIYKTKSTITSTVV